MKTISLFATLYLIILSGCQQDIEDMNVTTQPKIKTMDFTWMGTNSGYKDKIDFSYDNAGRVISMKGYNTQLPAGAPFYDSIFNLHFEYIGASNLPYKVSSFRYVTPIKQIHYFQYNATGTPIQDSVLILSSTSGWVFHMKTTIHYTGTTVTCTDSLGFPMSPSTTILSHSNGNFTSWNNNFFDFDTGDNPLNSLNIAPIFFVLGDTHSPENAFWSIWTLSNKKNIIMVKENFNPSTGIASDTAFLYNHYSSTGLLEKRYWCEQYYSTGTTLVDTLDMIRFIYQ